MKKKIYVNGTGCVANQADFLSFFEDDFQFNTTDTVLEITKPDYKNYFNPVAIRRMSKAVKMGIVSAVDALQEAGNPELDAIITGTGMGCLEDSEKFLMALLDNDEQYLTPTPFIQSTHNTVAAQIALHLQCTAYNFTYVQEALSFESALYDVLLQLSTDQSQSVLVGGIDETSPHTIKLYRLISHIKEINNTSQEYKKATTSGAVFGEGSSFFVLESQSKESSYAEVVDLKMCNEIETSITEEIIKFLQENSLQISDLDGVILGVNNDSDFDNLYDEIIENSILKEKSLIYYKLICGEYNTATAFGFWLGCTILKAKKVPNKLLINDIQPEKFNYFLLYNQYRGENHSFVLLKGIE